MDQLQQDVNAVASTIQDTVQRSMTLELVKPLKSTVNGEMITELHLEEPTAGLWIEATKKGAEADLYLVAYASGVAPLTIKGMALSDYMAAVRFLSGFASLSREAGPI